MNARFTIARWEFFRFFKWKSELIALLITAALFAAGFMLGPLIQWVKSTDDQTIVVLGSLPQQLPLDALPITVRQQSHSSREQTMGLLAAGEIDAIAQWNAETQSIALTVMREPSWLSSFQQVVGGIALPERLSAAELSSEQLAALIAPVPVNLDYHPDAPTPIGRFQKLLGVAAIVLPMIGVFSAFSYFFVSITAEKQNRLGEQVLSSVGPEVWLDGKLLGLTALCLKTMLTLGLMGTIGILVYLKLTGRPFDLESVDLPSVLLASLFSVLAVSFWSGVMAALAATISDPNSSTRGSLMMLPGLFMLLPFAAMDVPDSFGVALLSIIPVTSTAFMPMRLVLSEVPWWQVLLAAGLMIVAIALIRVAAQRTLKIGIVMFGREPSWTELWRAVRRL